MPNGWVTKMCPLLKGGSLASRRGTCPEAQLKSPSARTPIASPLREVEKIRRSGLEPKWRRKWLLISRPTLTPKRDYLFVNHYNQCNISQPSSRAHPPPPSLFCFGRSDPTRAAVSSRGGSHSFTHRVGGRTPRQAVGSDPSITCSEKVKVKLPRWVGGRLRQFVARGLSPNGDGSGY